MKRKRRPSSQAAKLEAALRKSAARFDQILDSALDAVVTMVFATLVLLILTESIRHWWLYAFGRKQPVLTEAPVVFSRLTA